MNGELKKRILSYYISSSAFIVSGILMASVGGYQLIKEHGAPQSSINKELDSRCISAIRDFGAIYSGKDGDEIGVYVAPEGRTYKELFYLTSGIISSCPSRELKSFCYGGECKSNRLEMTLVSIK